MLENSINQTHLPVNTSINTSLNSSTNSLKTESFFSRSSVTPSQNSNPMRSSWVKTFGGQGFDKAQGIAIDANGDIYTTGSFSESIDFDGDGTPEMTSVGNGERNGDVFIIKQDGRDGSIVWSKSFGSKTELPFPAEGTDIKVDGNGNLYTTGYFVESLDLDGDGTPEINSPNSINMFITKQNPTDGSIVWSKFINNAVGFEIAVGVNGDIYTTGSFSGSRDLDGDGIPDVYSDADQKSDDPFKLGDIFVVKYNGSDGSLTWAKSFGSTSRDDNYGIAVDENGNVYTTGSFSGEIDLDGDGILETTTKGNSDIFVVKQNGSDGSIAWAKSFGGDGERRDNYIIPYEKDEGLGIAVDGSGNVYTTGRFYESIDFDGDGNPELTSNSSYNSDAFIVKHNGTDGSIAWAKSFGGRNEDIGSQITVDASGYIYTTGSFSDVVDFDGDGTPETTSNGGSDIFITKHDGNDGRLIWSKSIGGKSSESGLNIKVDGIGNVYVAGTFRDSVDFEGDGISETSVDSRSDAFTLKLASILTESQLNRDIVWYDPNSGNNTILRRNPKTGENAILKLDGSTISVDNSITPIFDPNWEIVDSGDFNGDRKLDLLWRNTQTGETAIWLKDGDKDLDSQSKQLITSATTDWKVIATDDFNGDGKDDILWHNANTHENAVWFMNGFQVDGQYLSIRKVHQPGWKMVATGDFDGDGKADIAWRNTINGKNAIWQMDGKQVKEARYIRTVTDLNWQIQAMADMDGDGKDDILWQNLETGEIAFWNIDTKQLDGDKFSIRGKFITDGDGNKVKVGSGWKIEIVADYSGNGKQNLYWRNYDSGKMALWWMDGNKLEKGEYISYLQTQTPPPTTGVTMTQVEPIIPFEK